MLLAVKLVGRSLAATNVAGQPPKGRLFYIKDHINSLRFLADTGAEVSIVPPSSTECSANQGTSPLQAVNGSSITTFGVRSLTLDLGLSRTFQWVFVIADIPRPVISADFLSHFGLHVDIRHRTLWDSTTHSFESRASLPLIKPYLLDCHASLRTTPTPFQNS